MVTVCKLMLALCGSRPNLLTLLSPSPPLLSTTTRAERTRLNRTSPVRGVDQTSSCFVWERGECARASEAPGRLDSGCPPARVGCNRQLWSSTSPSTSIVTPTVWQDYGTSPTCLNSVPSHSQPCPITHQQCGRRLRRGSRQHLPVQPGKSGWMEPGSADSESVDAAGRPGREP